MDRMFLFVVEDGCIFKHCVKYCRENRSWMSDLSVPVHGCIMHVAPEAIVTNPQCLENTHPETESSNTLSPFSTAYIS